MNFNAEEHRTAQKQKSSDRPKFSEIGEDCRVNFSGGAISRSVQMMGIIGHLDITSEAETSSKLAFNRDARQAIVS